MPLTVPPGCGDRSLGGSSVRDVAITAVSKPVGGESRAAVAVSGRRRWPLKGVSVLIGATLSLAVVTGCSQAINVATLEQELASQIAVQQGIGVSTVKVVCPATVEVAEGSVVECSAVIDGASSTVTVTQTDGNGAMQWVLSSDIPPGN